LNKVDKNSIFLAQQPLLALIKNNDSVTVNFWKVNYYNI